MTMFYDGHKPVWQNHQLYPWNEYKHLNRDKLEELLNLMIEAHPATASVLINPPFFSVINRVFLSINVIPQG